MDRRPKAMEEGVVREIREKQLEHEFQIATVVEDAETRAAELPEVVRKLVPFKQD